MKLGLKYSTFIQFTIKVKTWVNERYGESNIETLSVW